jgi:hypothetical protein
MAGDTTKWLFHGHAITKMVEIRGKGLDLGPEGFLGHLLAWSVYNPRNKVVNGPCGVMTELNNW